MRWILGLWVLLTIPASAQIVVNTNVETSLTYWSTCVIGNCSAGGSPGGSGTPTAYSQTINNSSPAGAPSGASMLLSQTANTSNTNALWTYKSPTACNTCTLLNSSFSIYLGANFAKASALEADNYNFNTAFMKNFMAGHQYNQVSGKWQVFNGATGSWVDTTVTAFISYSAWHTLAFSDTITTCAGVASILFNSVTIDGTVYPINMCEPVAALPGGYAATVGTQFQTDIGTITGSQTVTVNIDNVNFTAQTGTPAFACTAFASSGACQVNYGGSLGGAFFRINDAGSSSGELSAPTVTLINSGVAHVGVALLYQDVVNVQGFTTSFNFIPNGTNVAFVLANNTSPGGGSLPTQFVGGAGCEAGFFQAYSSPAISGILGLELDSYSPLTNGGSFTYSSAQIYQVNQSPCNPNDGGPGFWFTTKGSTSPVPLNSPATTQGTTTGDTYSATLTYDGSTLALELCDVTTGAACFAQSWPNISIPSLVNGTTAYVGIAAGAGATTTSPLTISGFSYAVATPTASPTFAAYNANATTNPGTVTAATPVYTLAPGSFSGTQSVPMTISTSGGYICYKSASSPPTILPQCDNQGACQAGTLYSSAVSVPSTTTLYAIGCTSSTSNPSAVTAGTYSINSAASTPTFSPAAGSYSGAQSVTLSTSSSGAIICYNTTGSPATNGTTGCTTGTKYTGPVSVASTETLYAVAGGTGFSDSSVGSAAYTIASYNIKFSGTITISGSVTIQ